MVNIMSIPHNVSYLHLVDYDRVDVSCRFMSLTTPTGEGSGRRPGWDPPRCSPSTHTRGKNGLQHSG
jgi:hypothetical protein